MGTKKVAFIDEEAKEQFDPDLDIPVLGDGRAENWDTLGDPGTTGFVTAIAPGDGDMDVVGVRKSRETKDWEAAADTAPKPTRDVQVPKRTGDLAVTIEETNLRVRDVPGFGTALTHDGEHTVHYKIDLDGDVAAFAAHETPDRPATGLSERLARRARKLADDQVETREGFELIEPATDVDDFEKVRDGPEDDQRGL